MESTQSKWSKQVYGALGWLGREDKITLEQKERAMIFSLQEAEARLEASESSIIGDSVPQEKSNPRKGRATKKTEKAHKV